MRKLLPVLLALLGLAGGVGAGLALKPAPDAHGADAAEDEAGADDHGAAADTHGAPADAHAASSGHGSDEETPPEGEEFVKLNNQFIVPVVAEGRVNSLVVLSISLQVAAGSRETVFSREPKLRDAFLQVLFDHANAGGFDGTFTTSENLRTLRTALLETARSVLGDMAHDVLIIDLVRQDS